MKLHRLYEGLRRAYFTRVRWHLGSAGRGIEFGQGVRLKCVRRIFLQDYVRLLTGCELDAGKGKISIGMGSAICRYAIIEALEGEIHIGRNTLIGDFCNLYGQGGLKIGDNVQIASGCRLVPKTNRFDDRDKLILEQGYDRKGICIEDDVWLGANCVVLDGVTIGQGAVIGAGAVVTQSIPPYCVAVGVPARVIKQR